ncbi:Ldh family oxidoreductase [Alteromonas sp. a30]|uniref:Ldh family oxidoreductase n=1 Tax=Alteromonas sp. a30 TaxID=2730917 RepID=UPI002281A0A9|nr:Ldh family oxidoreductase [Alteromonas sp. a30]MCY7295058.1 Ldh family oxidoreductase [Alteromonas sp. a30]
MTQQAKKDIAIEEVTQYLVTALTSIEVEAENAKAIVDIMIDSELRGHSDHGIFTITSLFNWHLKDGMNPNPKPQIIKETPVLVSIDGDAGCGVIAMNLAVSKVIEKAKSSGLAAASVTNTGNPIALAAYANAIAEAGLLGFVCTGSPNVVMPPPGGLTQTMGTNPLAFAAPAGEHDPFILDMSTSAMAGVKIYQAALNGDRIDAGLIEDKDGNSLVNPANFVLGESLILPLAGAKGYGLASMVNILTSALTDDVRGHFLWALDLSQIVEPEAYNERMQAIISRTKSARKRDGVEEIFYAGERSQRQKRAALTKGSITLRDITWEAIKQISEYAKIPLPKTLN